MAIIHYTRMPTPALKVLGIGTPLLCLVWPLHADGSAAIHHAALFLPLFLIGLKCAVIPDLLTAFICCFIAKQRVLLADIIILLLIIGVSLLPGMVVVHQKWGIMDFQKNVTISLVFMCLITVLYLSSSILTRNSKDLLLVRMNKAIPYLSLFMAALVNILFAWWPHA